MKRAIIEALEKKLNMTTPQLAMLIGVSERVARSWNDFSDKALRLKRLYEVVQHLDSLGVSDKDIPLVLRNGDVSVPLFDDLCALPLIQYIIGCPDDDDWQSNTEDALRDFTKIGTEKE